MLNMQMQREKCAFCVTIPTQDPLIADASFDLIFGAQQKIIIFQRKEFVGENIVMILVFRSTFRQYIDWYYGTFFVCINEIDNPRLVYLGTMALIM